MQFDVLIVETAAFGHTAYRVAGPQAVIPQSLEEIGQRLLCSGQVRLILKQDHNVDVGIRKQFRAAVAADRHHCEPAAQPGSKYRRSRSFHELVHAARAGFEHLKRIAMTPKLFEKLLHAGALALCGHPLSLADLEMHPHREGTHHSADSPDSLLRMRIASNTSKTKIFPSPILPVRAVSRDSRVTSSGRASGPPVRS